MCSQRTISGSNQFSLWIPGYNSGHQIWWQEPFPLSLPYPKLSSLLENNLQEFIWRVSFWIELYRKQTLLSLLGGCWVWLWKEEFKLWAGTALQQPWCYSLSCNGYSVNYPCRWDPVSPVLTQPTLSITIMVHSCATNKQTTNPKGQ